MLTRRPALLMLIGLFCTMLSVNAHTLFLPISQWMTDWQRAKEYTKEYLDAMPEDGTNYKPTPEIRSFAEQMLHLASGNYMFGSLLSGKPNPYQGKKLDEMADLKTKAALSKTVLESYDYVIDALKGMTDAQLTENVKMGPREMTREVAISKAFEHQTHHRGQCTIYIRMKGIKPPNEKLF